MTFKRTDNSKIYYPSGISSQNRRFCRNIYNKLINYDLSNITTPNTIIACSGGLDSTVLSHAYSQRCILKNDIKNLYLMYVNHNLRVEYEIQKDISHVKSLAKSLNATHLIVKVKVQSGNIQAKAREARYDALVKEANKIKAQVYLAHHANDVAETKLWQILTGRVITGIQPIINRDGINFYRPLLNFTRKDLLRYAKIWNLTWSEDCTNTTTKYTRNKIRNELIPWIEREINPSIVKKLSIV